MKRNIINRVIIILISITLLSCVLIKSGVVFAQGSYIETMAGILSESDGWDDTTGTGDKVKDVVHSIIIIVRIVGMAIAITLLLAVAMKYMAAAPGEKADIKKASVTYVVGAVILFATVGILGIIEQISKNIKAE